MKQINICRYEQYTVFWDQEENLITVIHENDGQWREEYMNVILLHFDIKVVSLKKLPESIKKIVDEDYGID